MHLQATAGVLLGGALIASILAGELGPRFLAFFLASSAILGGAWYVLDRWLAKLGARSRAAAREELRRRDAPIFALSLEEARERAEALLADPHKFEHAPSPAGAPSSLASLSPALRGFFSEHELVRIRYGDTVLDRSAVAPSGLNPRYIRIGTDADHTELVVRADQDPVFEIDGSEKDEAEMRRYPSIYHLVLSVCATIYPDS